MAVKKWWIKNAVAAGSSHGSLTESPPTASSNTGTGWIPSTTASGDSLMVWGTQRAAGTFGGTPQPASAPTTNDCVRTIDGGNGSGKDSGTFAAGTWQFADMLSGTAVSGANVEINFRLWRSVNADGSSAVEITSGIQTTSPSTTVDSGNNPASVNVSLPSFSLSAEYLFLQMACRIAGAGPSGADLVISLWPMAGASTGLPNITSTNFVPTGGDALPYYVAQGTPQGSTGAITVPWPAGHQVGDIALLFVESANQTISLTTANGFTQVTNSPQGTGTAAGTAATALAVYWCRATSTSMASPVVADSGDHTDGFILTFRNCIGSGDPTNITAGGTNAASATVTVTGATTTRDQCLIVLAAANPVDSAANQSDGNWVNASLANLFEIAGANTTQGNGGGINVATGELAAHGAYGSTTVSRLTSTVQAFMSIALMPNPPPDDGMDGDWLITNTEIVASNASSASSFMASLSAQVMQDRDDAVFASGPPPTLQPDEDFWTNQVAPVPETMYQRLPYLPDPDEIPAGSLRGVPEEISAWTGALMAAPPLPPMAMLDRDELPAGALFGVPHDEPWTNLVAPVVPTVFQRLPIGDQDEIPAGALFGVPEELYWINQVAPQPPLLWQSLPFLDRDEIPAGGLFGVPEEHYWINPVAPAPPTLYQSLPVTDRDDFVQSAAPSIHFDEDFSVMASQHLEMFARTFNDDPDFVAPTASIAEDDSLRVVMLASLSAVPAVSMQGDELPALSVDDDSRVTLPIFTPEKYARLAFSDTDIPAVLVTDDDPWPLRIQTQDGIYQRIAVSDESATPTQMFDEDFDRRGVLGQLFPDEARLYQRLPFYHDEGARPRLLILTLAFARAIDIVFTAVTVYDLASTVARPVDAPLTVVATIYDVASTVANVDDMTVTLASTKDVI